MTYYLFIQRKGERPRYYTKVPESSEFWFKKRDLFLQVNEEEMYHAKRQIISKYKTIIIYR